MATPIFSEFKTLRQFQQTFRTEDDCIRFLESKLWGDGIPISPYDPTSKVYKRGDGLYRCKNTGKNFNIRKGTFMESSKIPLLDWFTVIFFFLSDKQGMTTTQIMNLIGVTKKTAWFMLQRIRQAFKQDANEKFDGEVEVDESYVGGKNKNRHYNKKVKKSQGRSTKDKAPVFGIVQRNGKAYIRVVKSVDWRTLTSTMLRKIKVGTAIYSDEYSAYKKVFDKAKSFTHEIVVHGKGNYVNGNAHTNNIEGLWNIMKDAVCGTYNHVSRKHLQRYCDEVTFRYNNRKVSNRGCFVELIINSRNTRITFNQLTSGTYGKKRT